MTIIFLSLILGHTHTHTHTWLIHVFVFVLFTSFLSLSLSLSHPEHLSVSKVLYYTLVESVFILLPLKDHNKRWVNTNWDKKEGKKEKNKDVLEMFCTFTSLFLSRFAILFFQWMNQWQNLQVHFKMTKRQWNWIPVASSQVKLCNSVKTRNQKNKNKIVRMHTSLG